MPSPASLQTYRVHRSRIKAGFQREIAAAENQRPAPARHPYSAKAPTTTNPRKDRPNAPKRKCRKSVRLQLKQTATNHMAGQVRFNRADKSPPARHPHRARNAIPQNHVEGGGKRSCQVSPTITRRGRSAARRQTPIKSRWVKRNEGGEADVNGRRRRCQH